MFLLDTSVAIWAVSNSARLSKQTRARLTDGSPIFVSSVTLVEVAIKSKLGKLDVLPNFADRLAAQGARELPLTSADATAIDRFPELDRHDPFDRMLVAQAETNGVDFLTSDRRLLALGRPGILDATD